MEKPKMADVNMFGFTRCPKCGKHYRFSVVSSPDMVNCDDCGFTEPISSENYFYELPIL